MQIYQIHDFDFQKKNFGSIAETEVLLYVEYLPFWTIGGLTSMPGVESIQAGTEMINRNTWKEYAKFKKTSPELAQETATKNPTSRED